MNTTKITDGALRCFKGSKKRYCHPFFKGYTSTRGVQFLGENGAHWLVNDILAYQQEEPAVQQFSWRDDFQVWVIEVDEEPSILLNCEDARGGLIFARTYHYEDFPLPKLTLYLDDTVLMLASEYP